LNYLTRWAPLAALIILFFFIISTKAANDNLDRGDWLIQKNPFSTEASASDVGPVDDLDELRKYLELEEVFYILKETEPRTLTIFYDYGQEGHRVNNWTCRKINEAFPGANLTRLVTVQANEVEKGRTDVGCQ